MPRDSQYLRFNNRDLQILRRGRERVRDIFIDQHTGFANMFSCQNKSITRQQFWHLSISKKAELPAIIITEQPLLLTKSISLIVRVKSIFAKNGQSDLVLVLVPNVQWDQILCLVFRRLSCYHMLHLVLFYCLTRQFCRLEKRKNMSTFSP